MSSNMAGSIFLLAVLLMFSVFFSATETSITAAGKGKLLALSDEYPKRRKTFAWLIANMPQAINVTLIGNNLVNIASSVVATFLAISLLGVMGPAAAVAVMTLFIVVFCEILPKNFAIANKERVLMFCLPILHFISIVLAPVTVSLTMILKLIGKIVDMDMASFSALVSRAEIDHIVAEGSVSGAIEEDERKMIHGVITFEDTRVSEVMLPRIDIHAIEETGTVEDAVNLFVESGHSRIPIYRGDIDNIVGILNAKDLLLPLAAREEGLSIKKMMRKPMFIPETMKTDEAFDIMKKSKHHIAIVVDEYGGTAGIVTLEDLLEEIVGDIQDEYDSEMPDILKDGEDSYIVRGQVNLEDLAEALGYPFDEAFEEVDTVAGMVLELSGNFPKEGEILTFNLWKIVALKVEKHRIYQVRITRISEKKDEGK